MEQHMHKTNSKLAIISGACGGIGKATLTQFMQQKYFCVGLDKDHHGLLELKTSLTEAHVLLIETDTSQFSEEAFCPTLQKLLSQEWEVISLINTVGGSLDSPLSIDDLSWDNFSKTFEYNIRSTLNLIKLFSHYMKKIKNGRIVNVASLAARSTSYWAGADYTTAKSSLIGLTRQIAKELSQYNILVNIVCPGITKTKRVDNAWQKKSKEVQNNILNKILLGRLAMPEEIANTLYFMGSDLNSYMTGAILDVNGGLFIP